MNAYWKTPLATRISNSMAGLALAAWLCTNSAYLEYETRIITNESILVRMCAAQIVPLGLLILASLAISFRKCIVQHRLALVVIGRIRCPTESEQSLKDRVRNSTSLQSWRIFGMMARRCNRSESEKISVIFDLNVSCRASLNHTKCFFFHCKTVTFVVLEEEQWCFDAYSIISEPAACQSHVPLLNWPWRSIVHAPSTSIRAAPLRSRFFVYLRIRSYNIRKAAHLKNNVLYNCCAA